MDPIIYHLGAFESYRGSSFPLEQWKSVETRRPQMCGRRLVSIRPSEIPTKNVTQITTAGIFAIANILQVNEFREQQKKKLVEQSLNRGWFPVFATPLIAIVHSTSLSGATFARRHLFCAAVKRNTLIATIANMLPELPFSQRTNVTRSLAMMARFGHKGKRRWWL